MNYILMNKDSAWLSFSCRRDKFDEVDLMYFSMSKNKANIRKISKKTPVAEVYPVWPVRPSPRNS